MVTRRSALWSGWSSALITLLSAVPTLSLTTLTFPLSPCYVCIYERALCGSSILYTQLTSFYRVRRTGAYYTDKLTFSHGSSIKVWVAYFTNVCIVFQFLR